MQTKTPRASEAITFERTYPSGRVRADLAQIAAACPIRDELMLLASELATNAILYSESGHPDRMLTVQATYPDDYARVEIVDQGGTWTADERDDEHGRGLTIVATIARDGNRGINGNASSRVAWFRLDWPQP